MYIYIYIYIYTSLSLSLSPPSCSRCPSPHPLLGAAGPWIGAPHTGPSYSQAGTSVPPILRRAIQSRGGPVQPRGRQRERGSDPSSAPRRGDFTSPLPSEEGSTPTILRFLSESQGQNLALTVFHVPYFRGTQVGYPSQGVAVRV